MQVAFALLPVALWVVLLLAFAAGDVLYREAALAASTVVAVFVVASTELLSALGALTPLWAVVVWAAAVVLATFLLRERWQRGFLRVRQTPRPALDVWDRIAAAVLVFFGVGTFLAAVLYPTVNYDSLTYHMPRVLMWFQNHSVAYYPVADSRQLFLGPFVEYAVLNLKLLSGGTDRLANLVQWLSYGLAVSTGSLIALRLGASRRGQQFSALAVASAPLALLEASTTQNDLTTALWCMVLVYLVLTHVSAPPVTTRGFFVLGGWAGVVLALAFQSKASAYLVCAPFLIWLAVAGVRRDGARLSLILAGWLVLSAFTLNGAIYARNAAVLGSDIIASHAPGLDKVLVGNRHPQTLATAALKNLGLLIRIPDQGANDFIARTVGAVASAYGGDVEDPSTQDAAARPYRLNGLTVFSHDEAPAPISMLLLLAAFVVVASAGRRCGRHLVGFAVCVVAAFAIPSAMIAWNEYVTRILLPPLLVALSGVGVAADSAMLHRHRNAAIASVAVALLASVLWGAVALLFGWTNPLLPGSLLPLPEPAQIALREDGWWNTSYHDLGFRMNIPDMQYAYERVAQVVRERRVERLAIDVPRGRPLYPLLAMMPDTRVRYVGDTLFPDRIPSGDFKPDAILEYSRITSDTPVLEDEAGVLVVERVSPKSVLVLRRP